MTLMNMEDEGLGTNHAAHFSGVLPDIMVQSPGVNKLRKVKQSEKERGKIEKVDSVCCRMKLRKR